MIETFYGTESLGSPLAWFAALLIGVGFGFALERAGFGSSRRLAGVFYFRDMAVIKVMFTAMLTTMIGIGMLVGVGWLNLSQLHLMETVYGAHAIGGLLFGIGFVMSGWCPGTGAVGLASGKLDALVFLGGIMLGAFAFNETFAWIKPLYNWGMQAEPSFAFGIPRTLFILLFSIVGVAAFYACEWIEQRNNGESRYLNSSFLKAFSIAIIGLAAALLILPTESQATSVHYAGSPTLSDSSLLALIEAASDHIEPEQVADRLLRGDTGVMLVDVRTADEYQHFHIRGAENIPISEVLTALEPYRDLDTIVLYSNGMTHPAQARDVLAMHGFTNVFMMTDGLRGFLDRCVRPVSLRDEPSTEDIAEQVQTYRQYFLADTTCPANSLAMLNPQQLESVSVGSIEKLHTIDGIYLSSQPFPDDFRLAKCGGIQTVLNIRQEDELDWNEKEIVQSAGLEYHNVPFTDAETLTDEVFSQTRELLNQKDNHPLLLHCKSANRVGAIWLAHRVLDNGKSLADAEAEAKTVGLKSPDYLAKAQDYISRVWKTGQ
ncbi:YeeE/YedE thiosulfate transporter family protein [Neorhodopirellula pilleata]|uniref:Thiosulfate sulfurtransferase PspE n=1 Tax=Neorhodopirellula pilleata TaxID=2714738 RepID=A0A5C6AFF9_9BACT|nr:YeeE/YedE thiosulfate transporter family protein [Neorhodopirellula pilleata]TWT98772.1 Thiosulfate sulfurtransferase PspE precursor [Neorhodopirellula pilleata]